MNYYLKSDIVSTVSGHVYGRQGDLVSIVSETGEHINTVIVKNVSGIRFPVSTSKLSAKYVAPGVIHPTPGKAAKKKGRTL